MRFNLNEPVKVKLTLRGLSILKFQHDELMANVPAEHRWEFEPPEVDTDGWSSFQLHVLMSTFGEHIGLCCDMPFEIEIEIPTKETP